MNTLQRTAVLDYLKESRDHPSAEKIYAEIKRDIPMLSLGTVYRNLDVLKKEGKIKTIEIKDKRRYEGRDLNHDHFICFGCGEIYDILIDLSVDIGEIENIHVYGLCKLCKGRKNGSKKL